MPQYFSRMSSLSMVLLVMGWVLIAVLLLAAALFGGWRYALSNNSVALLDWADRQFGGNAGYRIALADGRYGPLGAQKIAVIVPDHPAPAPRPVLIFIHGGGWHSGAPGDYRFIGRQFARAFHGQDHLVLLRVLFRSQWQFQPSVPCVLV